MAHRRLLQLAQLAGVCGFLMLSMVAPARLSAQEYFGRNKVQYKQLDFQVLKTDHFDIYFYSSERDGIDIAARMAERWHARLERIFAHTLRGRQPLVLYASHPDFEQTNAIGGELGEATGGVTEPLRRRIVLPMGGPLGDTDHVIGHELVHAFQFDITTAPGSRPGQNGAEQLPLWFIEGMAEYLSLGPVDPNTAMWLRDAVRQDKLPTIKQLNDPKYFPYRWGQAFWAYVGGRYGDDVIRQLLSLSSVTGDFDVAFKRVLGVDEKQLSSDWQEATRKAYQPLLESTMPPNEIGKLVIKGGELGADLNVGPTISPDGRFLAFLSERSFFSTDLFIADAQSGKILHRLTSNATDPHFSSIQFIYSAGAWDHAGKRIAMATIVSGHPSLAIFNAESGDKERELPVPGVDEIFNPTWAPDGHAVCFTGMSRGLTDLYVYDFASGQLKALTHDAFADLQPAWSPDGSRIAFATDRFTSSLDTLTIGDYRLALIDPSTSTIEQVPAFTDGKNINPQWSPDGSTLYFISDRDGIPNLYRVEVASGELAQVTNVGTGLSGITTTSPALSVSAGTGVASFSVYEGGKYDIYTLQMQQASTSASSAVRPKTAKAADLPPTDRRPSEVANLLADDRFGLPIQPTYTVEKYKPRLSLEAVAQPSIGVGASRFGTAIGGGVGLQFGDMLGDHSLGAVVQLNSGFTNNFDLKNTAAQLMYLNQAHRWNWGLVGGQIPYLTGGFQSGIANVRNEPAEVDQTILFRQTERSAAGIVAYPFNRAQRLEFQGGVTQISFDQIVETTAFSLITGSLLSDDTTTTSLANPLTLATTSAAYVYDTSNYGATSPVQGQRYRIEASPAFGSINFTSLTADYRRYFMPVPFYTIATRVMHYGRYGAGGEDQRLFPLFVGYPNLVRGYDIGTFDAADCVATATSQCPAFDRLVGSRLLVANIELRFPLLRPFGASQKMYGPVPVEVAFFADGGLAWNNLSAASLSPGVLGTTNAPHPFSIHDGVASAGVTLRVNLFGYAVGEFDFSHPFQRPGRGFVFQFNLSPGF
jgi:Tol biopolymer transport system component